MQLKMDHRLLVICLSIFVNSIGYGAVIPIMSLYAQSFNVQYIFVGIAISVFGLARLLMDLPTGAFLDKFGRKPIIVLGYSLRAVTALFAVLASNIYLLILAYFLQGIGAALALSANPVYVGDIAPKTERGKYLSYYQASMFLGSLLGMAIGGYVADFSGYRIPFLILSVATMISALLSFLFIKESFIKPITKPKEKKQSLVKELFNREFALINLATVVMALLLSGVQITMIPIYVTEKLGLSIYDIGLLLSLSNLSNFIILIFSGRIADKIGRRIPLIFGFVAGGFACYGFTIATNLFFIGLFCAILGLSLGIINPSATAFIIDIAKPKKLGVYMGIFRVFLDFGNLIAPLLVGIFLDVYGLNMPFFTISALCFIVVSFIAVFLKK